MREKHLLICECCLSRKLITTSRRFKTGSQPARAAKSPDSILCEILRSFQSL
jgi:hypothetical protein